MDKKIVLITGASGGLGSELSKFFSEKEYQLVLMYNTNKPLIPEGNDVMHIQADLRDAIQIQSAIHAVLEKWNKVDVLINNAGISQSDMSWKTSVNDWNETIQVNLTAPFVLSKLLLPIMKQNGFGRIINISSVVAQTGVIGTSSYTASKAGLLGLTKTLSKEVAKHNITVNALALGYFNRGMIKDVPDEFREEIIESIPKNELGKPRIIAETIHFLMSNDANYLTGQTINLNGGLFS